MSTSSALLPSSDTAIPALPLAWTILRFGAALCFLGHGAFGFITKAAWLPYFATVGIPPSTGWALMPWVGAVDILAAMAVLFAPRRLPLIYMVIWGSWTALLRPLAGESVFETLERAGNYGVPLAFLLLAGGLFPLTKERLLEPLTEALNDDRALALVRTVLQWTTCLLLGGHGALGILGKAMLTKHYATIGLPVTTTALVGWFELALAVVIAVRPTVSVLLFVAGWKLATESLFVLAGDPIWEFVERAGSYAAPLALAILLPARTEGGRRKRLVV
jgi:hypothetical protein